MMFKRIFLPTLALACATSVYALTWPSPLAASQTNVSDFEQKGLAALFELANLTTHVPESFTISKRRAGDVLK
jgi:hypothetical protein